MRKSVRKSASLPPARRERRIQQLTDLYLKYEGDSRETQIRPLDLSLHGMFVNTSTHYPEGAVLKLRFRLTRSNLEVQTRGEVRYCLAGIGIGIEFVRLGAKATRAIEEELRALSQPRHRGPRISSRKRA